MELPKEEDGTIADRRGRRVVVSFPASFFIEEGFEGDAIVHDLSTTGCRLSSDIALQSGMVIRLSLSLPDHHPWPVVIEEAVIRWVEGQEYGVEFTTLGLAVRERLRALTMKMKELSLPPARKGQTCPDENDPPSTDDPVSPLR